MSKPQLRADLERQLQAICAGQRTKHEVSYVSNDYYLQPFLKVGMHWRIGLCCLWIVSFHIGAQWTAGKVPPNFPADRGEDQSPFWDAGQVTRFWTVQEEVWFSESESYLMESLKGRTFPCWIRCSSSIAKILSFKGVVTVGRRLCSRCPSRFCSRSWDISSRNIEALWIAAKNPQVNRKACIRMCTIRYHRLPTRHHSASH